MCQSHQDVASWLCARESFADAGFLNRSFEAARVKFSPYLVDPLQGFRPSPPCKNWSHTAFSHSPASKLVRAQMHVTLEAPLPSLVCMRLVVTDLVRGQHRNISYLQLAILRQDKSSTHRRNLTCFRLWQPLLPLDS